MPKKGRGHEMLLIETTSRYRPKIAIPINYEIIGRIDAIPSELVFEPKLGSGATAICESRIILLGPGTLRIDAPHLPNGLSVEMKTEAKYTLVSITADLNSVKQMNACNVVLDCSSSASDWKEQLALKCTFRPETIAQ